MAVVGLLGGTGEMGRGLALRFAAAGCRVLLGSREQARAGEVAAELGGDDDRVDRLPGTVKGVANEDAVVDGGIVVVSAPWQAALSLADTHADALAGHVVVSVCNALTRSGGAFLPLTMPRGSVTAELAARLPRSHVTGAFHHLPAGPLGRLDRELTADVLVVGDPAGRPATLDLVDRVEGLRGIDAGGLEAAGAVEAMTAVLVGVNVAYRTHSTVSLRGSLDRGRLRDG